MNSEERPPTVVSLAVDASNAQPEEAFDQLNVETNNHLSLTSNGHWFEKHSRLDFTRYMTIEAKICWSYWTVSKYSHLVEQGRTREAESFIENNRAQIIKNLHSAGTDIEEWNEAPSDMRTLQSFLQVRNCSCLSLLMHLTASIFTRSRLKKEDL